MKSSPARVTLRQLCRLGLPAPLLLPSLLPVLRELVPAAHAGFFFCDAQGSITNLYAERLLAPGAMAGYHDHHNQREFRTQYLARVAAPQPVSRRSVSAAERQSNYFREVLQPLGIAHFLYAVVRDGQRPIGQLSLYRSPGDAPFEPADEQALGSVLHYLGQALAVQAPPPQQAQSTQVLEEGLAVLDAQGHELYADVHWPRLLRMAHGNAILPAAARAERETLPRFLAAVLAEVQAAPQAVHTVATAWGQFTFRCQLLAAADGRPALALRVCRLGAGPLRLTQGAAALGLTPQQREVAVLMAQGHSNTEIAAQLAITVHTAGYHAKKVFERLGVHERSAVAQCLAAALPG